MLEALVGGLLRGAYLAPIVLGCLLVARHGSYLPLWLPQAGTISAYAMYLLAERWGARMAVALPIAVAAGTLFGVVVHRLFFQRCIDDARPYRALLYGLAIMSLLTNAIGLATSGFPVTFQRARGAWQIYIDWPIADTIRTPDVAAVCIALVAALGIAALVSRTRLGLEYRALCSNRRLARDYGLRVRLLDLTVPTAGAFLCSLGGVIVALEFGAHSSFMLPSSIKAIAVVAALGSFGGALVAGLATLVLSVGEAAVQASPSISAFEQGLAYGALLVALLVQYVLGPIGSRWLWRAKDRRLREAI
jgi:branched-chain amino acid transport system permease protein